MCDLFFLGEGTDTFAHRLILILKVQNDTQNNVEHVAFFCFWVSCQTGLQIETASDQSVEQSAALRLVGHGGQRLARRSAVRFFLFFQTSYIILWQSFDYFKPPRSL